MTERELLRRAWDTLDSFKQAYPENWHEEDDEVMKALLEADVDFKHKHDPWKDVALRLGEELSSVGPDGYYDMHPGVWLNWVMAQKPRGKTSLPEQEPVAWLCRRREGEIPFVYSVAQLNELGYGNIAVPPFEKVAPLYTSPPLRKPLTDEEIFSIWRKQTDLDVVRHTPYEDDGIGFARAIEAAHGIKEKNT